MTARVPVGWLSPVPTYAGTPVPDAQRLRQLLRPTAAAPLHTPINPSARLGLGLAGFTVARRRAW